MRYLFCLIAIIIGVFLVIKTEWFLRTFGRVAWAEEKLGLEGGSRLFYKLLGLAIIFLSVLIMTGILQEIALSIFGPVLGR